MKKHLQSPASDGFYMPGEFEPHEGCIMIWPERPGSWGHGAVRARKAFARVAEAIADSERVIVLAGSGSAESARRMLSSRIEVEVMESDDSWARDVAPTFVVNGDGRVRGIDWQFNAWGGTYDGLYGSWDQDDRVASGFCERYGYEWYDARPFVMEGGAIHSDGQGTVLVTEACLLSPGRNPDLSKAEIEEKLGAYLGAEKVIWLKHGIWGDETNEHVDNVCAFVRPGQVVLSWTDDRNDPQYELSRADLEILEAERDARGRRFTVRRLPIPEKPVCITEEDLADMEFEPGEDRREVGERLAASYVNFYISNGGIILPQFGDANDETAVRIIKECFPERSVCPVYSRDILTGGGNIHCITQQIPAGRKKRSGL